jgi:hypothetical protein
MLAFSSVLSIIRLFFFLKIMHHAQTSPTQRGVAAGPQHSMFMNPLFTPRQSAPPV